jgi:translation initiation factor eIF-2B subunit beta
MRPAHVHWRIACGRNVRCVHAGLYKLSPMFPHDPQVTFSNNGCPSSFASRKLKSHTLREEDGKFVEADLLLPCPYVDYVEPGLIDLLITDTGGYTPSYVYRLLSEYYSREDYVLARSMMDGMIGAGH